MQLEDIAVPDYHGGPLSGIDAFRGLTALASSVLARFTSELKKRGGGTQGAAHGVIRGTGPGVSFGALIQALERDEPRALRAPFENTDSISGAVWRAFDLLGPGHDDALLKLRFERGTDTLPLHTHLHSDRVIIVLDGRGFFYAADDPKCAHSDDRLRSIAVRKHDAVVFTRGVVHTFTAPVEPLTLLSYHAPFIPLEDIAQYTVADGAAQTKVLRTTDTPSICGVPGWSLLTGS
ncbi:MAG: hypothetical protein KDA30_02540 [Phycisphaerales bacterium]|nr:hypothetical protein [Phycisphaerales bacterium]